MLFVNTTHPFLRIYNPATGGYAAFQGGRLELDEDHPDFGVVTAEAERNPFITILVNATTCPDCGEVFAGKAAPAQLGQHRKQIHFDKWIADKEVEQASFIQKEIKSRAGYACDVCSPIQTFGAEDDLASHVKFLHASAPKLDDEGNDVGGGNAAEASTEIPAATATA